MGMKRATGILGSILVISILVILAGCGGGGGGGNGGDNGGGAGGEQSSDIGFMEPLDETKVITDPTSGLSVVNDEILIIFKDTVSEETAAEKIAAINGTITGYLKGLNDYQVRINGSPTLDQLSALVDQLNSDPDVDAASLNTVQDNNRIPNDPQWGDEWSESDPDGYNWGLEAIYAPSAWDHTGSLSRVKIGILESGFHIDHDDLQVPRNHTSSRDGNMLSTDGDQNNHGTFVAGIIGATSNNNLGITGIAWNRDLYLWRRDTDFSIKYGTVWCLANGTKVINYSLGTEAKARLAAFGRVPSESDPVAVEKYILAPRRYWTSFMRNLVKKYDFLVVQAAGNELIDAKWSSVWNSIDDTELRKRIITVGGIQLSTLSSIPGYVGYSQLKFQKVYQGPYLGSNYGSIVDLVAPGGGIYSTIETSSYGTDNGTSFAAPHVTGVAALVWGIKPQLTAAQVKTIIVGTADRGVSLDDGKPYVILNAHAAVERARSEQAATPIARQPLGIFIGRVESALDNRSIRGACITTITKDNQPCAANATYTQPDGSFELVLPPGTYVIRVEAQAFEPETTSIVINENSISSSLIQLETTIFSGTILINSNSTPLAGVTVALMVNGANAAQMTTGPDGKYLFSGYYGDIDIIPAMAGYEFLPDVMCYPSVTVGGESNYYSNNFVATKVSN